MRRLKLQSSAISDLNLPQRNIGAFEVIRKRRRVQAERKTGVREGEKKIK